MKKTVVINVVGLSRAIIGEHTPFIKSFLEKGEWATITPQLPAVTCSAQATYLTGKSPAEHGIVGNGWYFKEEHEIKFWRQSNTLIQADKIWDQFKKEDPNFTCANFFWWFNMYSKADFSATPRPNYLADGRKIPDFYSQPAALRDHLRREIGEFPLFSFWGPNTSIKSTQWIADAVLRTDVLHDPTLTLVYLPHLDYNMQRHGKDFSKIGKDLQEIDGVVAQLVKHYESKSANIILLSEYGITSVNNPIHINRILRMEGYIAVRVERGLELLDAGVSKAFAVVDHQLAHVYVKDPNEIEQVKNIFKNIKGIEQVLSGDELAAVNLNHERCGDIVLVADKASWFTYYFWLDDKVAPDYARMVDIHKKPGYDPVEMVTDPQDKLVPLKIVWKLLKKKLGFRSVLDIIPLDATLIKGSHGRIPEDPNDHPILITNKKSIDLKGVLRATEVYGVMEDHLKDI